MTFTPSRRTFLAGVSAATLAVAAGPALGLSGRILLDIVTPMAPPDWALLQRELLRANAEACEAYFERFYDVRGFLLVTERWGANDGPDDAIEALNEWPHLHALGGPDHILDKIKLGWEGHLRQYTQARTVETPLARDGMYFKEFPTQFDWQHNAEFLSVFNLMGLNDPNDRAYARRARRYAGFYMNEDPGAPNYNPEHSIIRSVFNGSRGPLMRPATAMDWAGDPFEVENRYDLGHGERNYQETLAHYEEYTDIVGDNPLNLNVTTSFLNAYMLAQEDKYRDWLLEYVDAWVERARANNDILPSTVDTQGRIGGPEGKWWGGVYGWAFSPVVPQTGEREDRNRVPRCFPAFVNAYLLTNGDDKYMDLWRRQARRINAQARIIDGQRMTPRMHGEDGWYSFRAGDYDFNMLDIYMLTMRPSDRGPAGSHPWLTYLEGANPHYPSESLREAIDRVRARVESQRADDTTIDTRLADDPMSHNPVSVTPLIQQMQGGLHIARPAWSRTSAGTGGAPLYARLRHFDPVRRRAGVPEDVAVLIQSMTADETTVTFVNVSQVSEKQVTIQGGAYAEHQILSASLGGGQPVDVNDSAFTLRLAPGSGATVTLRMRRYANMPTLAFPWDR
jgi:hypothetical protein